MLALVVATMCSLSEPQRAAASPPVIRVGMPLDDAVALLRKRGLVVHLEDLALASRETKRTAESHTYWVSRGKSPDALFLHAAREVGEKRFSIISMWWWKDWRHDSKRAKGVRSGYQSFVEKVLLKDLE